MTDPTEQMRTIVCRPDDEGEVVATLVTRQPATPTHRAILHVHGFVDYYFHDHVAAFFNAAGYAFYGLDLRKYGRSLRSHQHPNFVADVREYYEEIGKALEMIAKDGMRDITLMGHSTGGLTTPLFAAEGDRRNLVSRLILNSPFLEFNEKALMRATLLPASRVMGKYRPYAGLPKGLAALYGESMHKSKKGEWDYNLDWKPIGGFPIYWGWVRAIHLAQKRLQAGLNLTIPVLLLHSDASGSMTKWQENTMRTDTVLNVEDMKRYGPRIGSQVTLVEIEGGMHDLYLSAPAVRRHTLDVTLEWLNQLTGAS